MDKKTTKVSDGPTEKYRETEGKCREKQQAAVGSESSSWLHLKGNPGSPGRDWYPDLLGMLVVLQSLLSSWEYGETVLL